MPTPLALESGDVGETLEIGGAKWKWVVGLLVGSVVAVAAIAIAVMVVKNKKESKKKAEIAALVEPAAPAAPVAGSVEVPPGDWQNVQPVVAKFQNGFSADQIKEGRYVLSGGACTECHKTYDPASFSGSEWSSTIGKMRGKAKLRGNAAADLDRFVSTIRQ